MTILEHDPAEDEILDFVNDRIRQLSEEGVEAKYILLGVGAYERLRSAISRRFRRSEGRFETYNYLPIVLDPFRSDGICVLPSPHECAKGVAAHRLKD